MSQSAEIVGREAERRVALAPYLDSLISSVGGDPEGAAGTVPNSGLELERWEMDAVTKGMHGARSGGNGWEALLAEGVALHTKFIAEIDRLQSEEPLAPEQWEEVRNQLIWTGAIALALMSEIQCAVDAMILSGNMKSAKKLSAFRNKLGRITSQVMERIGEKAFRQAVTLAEEVAAPVETGALTQRNLEEAEEAGPRLPVRYQRHARAASVRHVKVEERSSKTKPLLIAFAAAIVLWMVVIAPRLVTNEIPTLTKRELAFSPAIQTVFARPPSLFLVVDGTVWEDTPSDQREELVREVGRIAEAAGYTGANLRLEDGGTIGQWSLSRGVQIFERPRVRS